VFGGAASAIRGKDSQQHKKCCSVFKQTYQEACIWDHQGGIFLCPVQVLLAAFQDEQGKLHVLRVERHFGTILSVVPVPVVPVACQLQGMPVDNGDRI
jgi:hypothetical protein